MSIQMEFSLENEIKELIQSDNKCQVRFIYNKRDNVTHTVDVITINPLTGESFLMHSALSDGNNHIKALEHIKYYLEERKKDNHCYAVSWKKVGEAIPNVSYFYGHDMREVLKKFYSGKENVEDNYVIDNVKLSPVA